MSLTIIDRIPFEYSADSIFPMLKFKPGSDYANRFEILLEEARTLARPKALYKLSAVEMVDSETVRIDGITFNSRVLSVNLQACNRAFPFVATGGEELETWAKTITGMPASFWADTINMLALGAALDGLKNQIRERFETGDTSMMNPGSLASWPLSEQKKIFSLLGAKAKDTGVVLKETGLMTPLKTTSGLLFESGEKFYNCQLCPREDCPGRQSAYDANLYEEKYQRE
jgi:hypothetical protein